MAGPPTYAVTGAAGFIGQRLIRHLRNQGHRVVAVVRTKASASDLEQEGVEVRIADVRDSAALDHAFSGVSGVFHCAALFNHPDQTWQDYRDVNVQGTVNVIEAAARQGCIRVVHSSTVGVATEAAPPPYSETSPYAPQPNDKYEVTKQEGEVAALETSRREDMPLVVIRPAQVYGPGDRSKIKFYKMVRSGVIVSPGETRKHLIYVDDLCRAFLAAMTLESIESEIFLVAGGESVELKTVIRYAASELGVPVPKFVLPAKPVLWGCIAMEKAFGLIGRRSPLHRRSLDFFTKTVSCNTTKMRTQLGITNTKPVSEGIAETVRWMKDAGVL